MPLLKSLPAASLHSKGKEEAAIINDDLVFEIELLKQVDINIDSLNPDLRSVETFNGKTRTKEFFAMTPEDAYAILEAIAKISGTVDRLHRVTPTGDEMKAEEEAAEVKAEARRGPFRFSMAGIPIGAEVTFVGDESVKATVVDDRHIKYGDEVTSLSRLAQDLKGLDHAVQGTLWFKYQGKVLDDLRRETESGLK